MTDEMFLEVPDGSPSAPGLPPARSMSTERRQALKSLLMDEVRRTTPWWRRSRRALTVGAGVAALVLAGGAASAYMAFKPVDNTKTVQCFAAPDLKAEKAPSEAVIAGEKTKVGTAPRDVTSITDPVGLCSQLWESGMLRTDSGAVHKPAPSGDAPREVPSLVACTLEKGTAGVFPGDKSTCERLGLPRTTTG